MTLIDKNPINKKFSSSVPLFWTKFSCFMVLCSGVVSTIAELVYETQDTYTLEVTVTDGPSKSDTANLVIELVDINKPHDLVGIPARAELNAIAHAGGHLVRDIINF